ncbi:MAG: hypothetical protein AW07_04276 [Candidatus Accumulibacter sp. SK-11]|nr:MAG: hypothetical protein AW07_04276 [Candidatus Accumulibacter sp. SK-11]
MRKTVTTFIIRGVSKVMTVSQCRNGQPPREDYDDLPRKRP